MWFEFSLIDTSNAGKSSFHKKKARKMFTDKAETFRIDKLIASQDEEVPEAD